MITPIKKPKLHHYITALLVMGCSCYVSAQQQNQTLVLAGSDYTKLAPNTALYLLNTNTINDIANKWPNKNDKAKSATVKSLNTLLKKIPSERVLKSNILWQWRDSNNEQLNSLTKQEFNFVFDMLEQPSTAKNTKQSDQLNSISQFIVGSLKVASPNPTMLLVSAAQRDPYAQVAGLKRLLPANVTSQWLALTPALAEAITHNTCNELPTLRHTQMAVFNRDKIYPALTQAEQALCNKGVPALVNLIKSSTGILFSDGNSERVQKVLFDNNNKPYPWTAAIKSRPVIVGLGAGSKVQGAKVYSSKINNVDALRSDNKANSAAIKTGVNTFKYGLLDTHFSEQNRTFNLATALKSNTVQSLNIKNGFGIDENTALVVIKSNQGDLITVIGESGVVHLNTTKQADTYNYSYWPAGSVINITNNTFSLSERTISQTLPSVKIPPLPVQRFGNILTDTKLRSLTQAMCLSQEQSAVGQQDEFLINLTATKDTLYHRVNASQYGCALSNLNISVKSF